MNKDSGFGFEDRKSSTDFHPVIKASYYYEVDPFFATLRLCEKMAFIVELFILFSMCGK